MIKIRFLEVLRAFSAYKKHLFIDNIFIRWKPPSELSHVYTFTEKTTNNQHHKKTL